MASRTIRRCTPSFFATPAIVPMPNSYSRRICSNNSTFTLHSNELLRFGPSPNQSARPFSRLGQNKMPNWAVSEYRNQGLLGVSLGLVGTLLLTRSLQGLLFGVSQFDVPSFATTAVILMLATMAACFLPVLRAMRIEPSGLYATSRVFLSIRPKHRFRILGMSSTQIVPQALRPNRLTPHEGLQTPAERVANFLGLSPVQQNGRDRAATVRVTSVRDRSRSSK